MIRSVAQKRWAVVLIMFIFLIFHEMDVLLIGPLASSIMGTLNLNIAQINVIGMIATVVTAVLLPVWGFFFDGHTRKKIIAIAAFIWGATSWLRVIAPTFITFLVSQAASGIDDATLPGIFSLVGDYFRPWNRGKIFGLLQLTQPVAFLSVLILTQTFTIRFGWQAMFIFTGFIGLTMSFLVYFFVREPKRGASEPEFSSFQPSGQYRFDWEIAKSLLRKPGLVLIYLQGLFAIISWNALIFWLVTFLQVDHGYALAEINLLMLSLFLVLALGYGIGGVLGDYLFTFFKNGRLWLCFSSVLLSAIFLFITIEIPDDRFMPFMVMMVLTAFVMPFSRPNVLAIIFDLTLPEVRSTALSIFMFSQLVGSGLSTLLFRTIVQGMDPGTAIKWFAVGGWVVAALILGGAMLLVPKEQHQLRRHMAYRSYLESRLAEKRMIEMPPQDA